MDWIKLIHENENNAIKLLYDTYRGEVIEWLNKKYNITKENAIDIFQHSVILLYDKIISGEITYESGKIKTYLFGICKNKALTILRDIKKEYEFKSEYKNHLFNIDNDQDQLHEKKLKLVEESLVKIGDPCKSLLILFYYKKQNMDEICKKLGYNNVNTTKNQKYKCLKRLQSMVFKYIRVNKEIYD